MHSISQCTWLVKAREAVGAVLMRIYRVEIGTYHPRLGQIACDMALD